MDAQIETRDLIGKEIAYPGTFGNGKTISAKDIDDMLANYQAGVTSPYLNLDHDDSFTDKVKDALKVARLGTISKLYKVGEKLVADFTGVPSKVAEAIEKGMLSQRSIEVYRKLNRAGKEYANVLHAVSFFGKDLPAIPGLGDSLPALYDADGADGAEKIIYTTVTTTNAQSSTTVEDSNMDVKEVEVFKAQLAEKDGQIEKFKDELKAKDEVLTKLQAEAKAQADELVKLKGEADVKEADAFITAQVTAKRIIPANVDYFKAAYLREKSAGVLDAFKAAVQNMPAVLPEQLKDNGADGGKPDIEKLKHDTDAFQAEVNKVMKADKVDFAAAREAVLKMIEEA